MDANSASLSATDRQQLLEYVIPLIRFPAMRAANLVSYWQDCSFLKAVDPEKKLLIAAVMALPGLACRGVCRLAPHRSHGTASMSNLHAPVDAVQGRGVSPGLLGSPGGLHQGSREGPPAHGKVVDAKGHRMGGRAALGAHLGGEYGGRRHALVDQFWVFMRCHSIFTVGWFPQVKHVPNKTSLYSDLPLYWAGRHWRLEVAKEKDGEVPVFIHCSTAFPRDGGAGKAGAPPSGLLVSSQWGNPSLRSASHVENNY